MGQTVTAVAGERRGPPAAALADRQQPPVLQRDRGRPKTCAGHHTIGATGADPGQHRQLPIIEPFLCAQQSGG
ncbi:hypothetical protein GCM10009827_072120 [Dactylosporangium maewongense]|uniref:Uncharacterized protein n=1 Tax=Dactylosporangium maewongense TaxID=634393 RepID=A0ABP4MD02_9ACTN